MYSNLTTTSNAVSNHSPGKQPVKPVQQPLNGWLIFSRVARLPLLPALLVPIVWGTALAWWQTDKFTPWAVGLLLLIAGTLGLGLNLLGHYLDYRRSFEVDVLSNDRAEGEMRRYGLGDDTIVDGYLCLVNDLVRPGTVLSLACISFFIAILATLLLGLFGGWPLWFFGAAQFLLILAYLTPMIRYSRRWLVADDVGLLFAIGILPALSAFYAPTSTLSQMTLVALLTPSVLAWLAYQSYGLYSWHRDWKLRKRTAVVVFGPRRALDVATVIGLVAFVATILLVALDKVPVWSLLVLGALPTFLHAFARGHRQTIVRAETLQAIHLSAAAAVLAGMLSIGAFWIAG
jgi:1,4-dihydroxy-2-naphthoate octaprenyltransferase